MNLSSQFSLLERAPFGGVTFLVGRNGSGKSNFLAGYAKHAIAKGKNVLAISNTIYDRFPHREGSYSKLAARFGRGLPSHILKRALANEQFSERNAEKIAKILDYLGFSITIGLSLKLPVSRKFDISQRKPEITSEEHRRIESSLRFLQTRCERSPDGIFWMDIIGRAYDKSSSGVLDLLRNEGGARNRQFAPVSVHLRKGGETHSMTAASSGELTLLAMYVYLAINIREKSVILIDEPENSLHPTWQHEYCSRLLDIFYLYEPQIVVATHSPVIVSGAHGHQLPMEVFQVRGAELNHRPATTSIEETLYESFQTLPPANHYLSEQISRLLAGLGDGDISMAHVKSKIGEYRHSSYDESQRRFLKGVEELAEKISLEVRRRK